MTEIKIAFFQDGPSGGYLCTEEQLQVVLESTKDMVSSPDFRQNYEAYVSRRKMLLRIAKHPNNGNRVRIDASLMADSLKFAFYARTGKCSDVPTDYAKVDISKGPLTEQCRVK